MTNYASNIKIQNFKSIQKLELNDCKRINLFIGRPNVGKSNILEALSLFSLPYYYEHNDAPNLKEFIRIKDESQLYFNGEGYPLTDISIDGNFIKRSFLSNNFTIQTENFNFSFDIKRKDLSISYHQSFEISKDYPYKSYFYPSIFNFVSPFIGESFLLPPNGQNLYDIIQDNKLLKDEFLKIFQTYGLHLVFDKGSQELKVMKGVEKGEIFLIPFTSIADSLQRLIFYKTAIKSNKNSVITFEEPEAHTYPPYISQIAQDIIEASSNQFFITTHSPYVINEFLENAQSELCIFLVDFKDGETVARRLTDKELEEVYNDGIDLFFNNEFFS